VGCHITYRVYCGLPYYLQGVLWVAILLTGCTVGCHITYRVYAKLIKNIKVRVKVKILLVRM
jgi:hypothetical protein